MALEGAFRRTYAAHFGSDKPTMVLWYRMPAGQSFVAGSPNDVYLALVEVPDGLEQPKREEVMMAFTKTLSDNANIDFKKPMVSALDASKVREYLKGNRGRLRATHRLGFQLGTLIHAAVSRRRDGFASIRVNL